MADNTITENINQAIDDFADIKTAIENKGVEVPDGTPTNQYATKIANITVGEQSDWDVTDTTSLAYIKNKPTQITDFSGTLPISQGGTGATSEVGVRTNLDLKKEYVLYSNYSGTNGTITLSDTFSNYDEIKVQAGASNISVTNSFYTAASESTRCNIGNIFGNVTESSGFSNYLGVLIFSGKSVSFSRRTLGIFKTDGTITIKSETTTLKVFKIIGYKY